MSPLILPREREIEDLQEMYTEETEEDKRNVTRKDIPATTEAPLRTVSFNGREKASLPLIVGVADMIFWSLYIVHELVEWYRYNRYLSTIFVLIFCGVGLFYSRQLWKSADKQKSKERKLQLKQMWITHSRFVWFLYGIGTTIFIVRYLSFLNDIVIDAAAIENGILVSGAFLIRCFFLFLVVRIYNSEESV